MPRFTWPDLIDIHYSCEYRECEVEVFDTIAAHFLMVDKIKE